MTTVNLSPLFLACTPQHILHIRITHTPAHIAHAACRHNHTSHTPTHIAHADTITHHTSSHITRPHPLLKEAINNGFVHGTCFIHPLHVGQYLLTSKSSHWERDITIWNLHINIVLLTKTKTKKCFSMAHLIKTKRLSLKNGRHISCKAVGLICSVCEILIVWLQLKSAFFNYPFWDLVMNTKTKLKVAICIYL